MTGMRLGSGQEQPGKSRQVMDTHKDQGTGEKGRCFKAGFTKT